MAKLVIERKNGATLKGAEYTVVKLTGLITTDTTPALDEALDELERTAGRRVVVNFAKVGYVNSTGLGQLITHLDSLTQTGGDMVLIEVVPEIKSVIKLLGIDKVLKVVPDEKTAQDYFDTGNTEMFERVFEDVAFNLLADRRERKRRKEPKTAVALRPEEAKIVYASPRKDTFAEILELRWGGSNGGNRFLFVATPDEVHEAVRHHQPDLLIIDHRVTDSRTICEALKRKKESSLISVIRLYARGEGADMVEGFYVRENEFVSEPFEISELIALAEAELHRAASDRKTFMHQIHFQFQNVEADLDRGIDFIAQLIRQGNVDERDAGEMRTAIREAIDNAYRHGNKSQPKHKIYVNYVLDQEKIIVTVEDEGEGFDSEYYLALGREEDAAVRARKQKESGKTGGLGIMLMMKCLDTLEYNPVGNLVKLTKIIR